MSDLLDLDEARRVLADNGIDGPDQPYNPRALHAMRIADALLAEVEQDRVQWTASATAPEAGVLVWIVEQFYEEGVTLGYFDGYTFRTWNGSDDCSVSHWAPINYPALPGPASVS